MVVLIFIYIFRQLYELQGQIKYNINELNSDEGVNSRFGSILNNLKENCTISNDEMKCNITANNADKLLQLGDSPIYVSADKLNIGGRAKNANKLLQLGDSFIYVFADELNIGGSSSSSDRLLQRGDSSSYVLADRLNIGGAAARALKADKLLQRGDSSSYVSADRLNIGGIASHSDKLLQRGNSSSYVLADRLNIGGDAQTMSGCDTNGYVHRYAQGGVSVASPGSYEYWGNNGVNKSLGIRVENYKPLRYWNAQFANTSKDTYELGVPKGVTVVDPTKKGTSTKTITFNEVKYVPA